MTFFSVQHTTTYRYKNPVRLGLHHMMFRPRDSFDQRLLECHLKVFPTPAEVRWIHDVFGNCLTLVDFDSHATELSFETLIRLDHTPENAPDFRIEDYARTHPFDYAEEERSDLAPYMTRHHAGGRLEEWLGKFFAPGAAMPTGQLLVKLDEAIEQSFFYKR